MGVVIRSWLRLTRGHGDAPDAEKFSGHHQLVLTAPSPYRLVYASSKAKKKLEPE